MSSEYMKFNELCHPFPEGTLFRLNKNEARTIQILNYDKNWNRYYIKNKTLDFNKWFNINHIHNYVIDIILPAEFVKQHMSTLSSLPLNLCGVELINDFMKKINNKEDIKMNTTPSKSNIVYNETCLTPEQFIIELYNETAEKSKINTIKEFSELKEILYKEDNKLKSYVNDFNYTFEIDNGEAGNCVSFVVNLSNNCILTKYVCYEYKSVATLIDSFDKFNYSKKLSFLIPNERLRNLKLGELVYYFEKNNIPEYIQHTMINFAKELLDGMSLDNKKKIMRNYVQNKVVFKQGYVTGIDFTTGKLLITVVSDDDNKNHKIESSYVFDVDTKSEAYEAYAEEIISKYLGN